MQEPLPQSPQLRLNVSPSAHRVSAGEQAVYVITLENRSGEAQQQTISIGGVPLQWCRLDFDAARRSFPGETRTATLFVTAPTGTAPADMRIEVVAQAGTVESRVACAFALTTSSGPAAAPANALAPIVTLRPSTVSWAEGRSFERLTLNIRNPSPQLSEYVLAVEGLERGWYTLAPRLRVPPGQAIDFEMRVSPPQRARPGDYPFVVTVAVEGRADAVGRGQGSLTVEGAQQPSVAPQRGVSSIGIEPAPTQQRVASEPAMPPEVTLGPRSIFRFGQGEVASQAVVTVNNRSRLIERYQLTLEGLSPEWYTLTMPEVRLEPGGSMQIPLRLTPRTSADAPAGEYEFKIRVAPMSYPQSFAEVGGVVAIAGVSSFDARLTPAQSYGRKEKFKLTLLNTGSLPLSLLCEASDPEGLCKFEFAPPPPLEPGKETVVPIWVGATRQGFAGEPKRLDFRVRVGPAGGTSQSFKSFDGRFVHTPFLGAKMFGYSALVAIAAMLLGLFLVMGTSSADNVIRSVSCGFDDDFQEVANGQVLVKEECGGASIPLQKFPGSAGTPAVTVGPGTPTPRPAASPTPGAACAGAADLALTNGRAVTLVADAIVRDDAGKQARDIGRGANLPATIIGGPRCANALVWWNVDAGALKGWTAEKDETGTVLIAPR